MQRIFFLFFIVITYNINAQKLLSIGGDRVSIIIPENWDLEESMPIDSEAYCFIFNDNKVYIEFGIYQQGIEDAVRVDSVEEKRKLEASGESLEDMFFSDNPSLDMNQGTFHKEYYYYQIIDNKLCKIQVPKRNVKGKTMLFHKFKDGNKLTIYSLNLNRQEQDVLINVFETLKFKK